MDRTGIWLPPFEKGEMFSRQEMSILVDTVEKSKRLKPAQVMYSSGRVAVDEAACRCQIAAFRDGSILHALFDGRFKMYLEKINRNYGFELFEDPKKRYPAVNILKYDSEHRGEFKPHVDLGGHPGVDERKLTLVTFINDPKEYEGGELVLHNGEDFPTKDKAAAGTTFVFPSFMMHSVTPVTSGVRYVAVSWLMGPRFR